jgi:hypothetical protein
MIPEKVRKLPNPFFPITSKLKPSKFIGREAEIAKFDNIIDDYLSTLRQKNIVVSGEKSIGKSTLMNRFKQILEDHNIIVYEIELPRDASVEINEFDFFKDIINELFVKYAPPDGGFFDTQQSEIWFSLTSDKYEHTSDFKERMIGFASQYANYMKGLNEKISLKQLEKDFDQIMGQIIGPMMESNGFAIIIDEFQELSRNVAILDILRQMSEKLTGLMIIGSGIPTFLNNAIFEKFVRTSETINLKKFNRKESLELIFTPLGEYGPYTRFEMQFWFDMKSLDNVVKRSGGNPLHIRILCGKIIDYYKSNLALKRLELNPSVMEEVMSYYSSISAKSHRIRLALESCSREQLNAFGFIYRYEGLSIRAAILLQLAFKPITADSEEEVKKAMIAAFHDIWDLGLFEFNKKELTLEMIEQMTPSSLSHIEFNFIGDTIDKLYASYYYYGLIEQDLVHNDGDPIEDLLAEKLAENIDSLLSRIELPQQDLLWEKTLIHIDSIKDSQTDYTNLFIDDLDMLRKRSEEDTSKDSVRKTLSEISDKRDLYLPAHMASIFQFQGYLIVMIEATVRGKKRLILNYVPIIHEFGKKSRYLEQIKGISIDSNILDQYMIRIDKVYIYWLPKQPLLIVTGINLYDDYIMLFDLVRQRQFDKAVEVGHRIWTLQTKRPDEQYITYEVKSYNNFAFCLLNIGEINEALNIFTICSDKYLISMVNLAYIYFLKKQTDEARRWLNKIVRKQLGKDQTVGFIHLCIDHPDLPLSNRIAEDVTLNNIAVWNLALINCLEKRDRGIINSYLKKANTTGDERLFHKRVLYWLEYYEGKISVAHDKAILLSKDCGHLKNLHDDVCADINIFHKERN